MASINGIAHIQLTVSDMKRSVPFYETLLHSLEMVTLRNTGHVSAVENPSELARVILA